MGQIELVTEHFYGRMEVHFYQTSASRKSLCHVWITPGKEPEINFRDTLLTLQECRALVKAGQMAIEWIEQWQSSATAAEEPRC